MEDRETFEIVTPRGLKVVLRSWITGRESQKIDGAMFGSIGATQDGKSLQPKISSTMLADQENASFEAVVVSIDGKENDIVNTILGLRASEYSFIAKEVKKIVDGDISEKKENSSKTNTTSTSNEVQEESATPA